MYQVVGTLLPLGLAISLSPFPIIMIVLLLGSKQPRANGLAFLLAWVLGISAVLAVLTLAMDWVESSTADSSGAIAGVVRIVLGGGLLFLAARKAAKRFGGKGENALPGWMASAESMVPGRSFVMGLLLSAANPKNLMLSAAAGVTIGAAELAGWSEFWAGVFFVAIASASVIIPVACYVVAPRAMAKPLDAVKAWMSANHDVMTGLLLLVFGFVLIGNGIGSF